MINVFHIVSNKVWTGAEEYAYGLTSQLRNDKNFYVEVVCRKNDAVLTHFRRLEVPISILPLKGITDMDSPMRFARLLRKGRNVVHVHTFHDAFAAVMARRMSENPNTKVVITVHGIAKPKSNYIYRKLYKAIDHFIFVSQLAYDTWIKADPKFNTKKASVIHDSVMENPLAEPPIDLHKRLAVEPHQALILYHGRICPEKGIDVLLKAATQINKDLFKLAVVGEGKRKYISQLKGFIVANQLVRNVSLVGFQENIAELIKQCDFGVLPSIEPEALGIANLEYMMQGKAHISTNNGAQPEYVSNGQNALLVEPNNHHALAAAMKNLINDKEVRERIGQRAKADFDDKLNYGVFYDSICSLYQSLFKKSIH
ncbi:MAG: glycosyltransferase family 4 protein [Muribaculaceae bacterium]|nr:glycosyltransferase family 4 protein [Muribaculaceae bacterium]